MHNNKTLLYCGIVAMLIGFSSLSVPATPLPTGTWIPIDRGNSPSPGSPCTSGSCFSMEVAPDFHIWTNIAPGTDGGIVTGKNQLSGGQEKGPSAVIDTPGQLTAAWVFFGSFATAPLTGSTAGTAPTDASANLFDDATCTGAECTGRTVLGTWNVAWNSIAISLGSALGCKALDVTKCQGVTNWTLDPSPIHCTPSSYTLDYAWAVPNGDPSGFGNVPFHLHLTGTIAQEMPPPFVYAGDVSVTTDVNTSVSWKPVVGSDSCSIPTCSILSPPANGSATVAVDCTSGTYTPNPGFAGVDTFIYEANSSGWPSLDTGTVTVTVGSQCQSTYPLTQVTLDGGGQSSTVNATLKETFTGNIVSHTNNSVTICNGTVLNYEAISTTGNAVCTTNSSPGASLGTLAPGDKLICTNKPTGQDTDRFRILGQ